VPRASRSLDLVGLFERIETLCRQGKSAGAGLVALAQACADGGAAVDVRAVRALPVARELAQISKWFGAMWKQPSRRPPAAANALYVGIVELDDGRHDLRAAALPGKGPDTEQWRWQRAVAARPEFAGSRVLAALAAKDGPLRHTEARHVVCLGYAALVAAPCAESFAACWRRARPGPRPGTTRATSSCSAS